MQNILDLLKIDYATEPLQNKYVEGLAYVKNKVVLAEVGIVKPDLIDQFNLKQDVLYGQVEWEACLKYLNLKTVYRPIAKYPPVRRDLSLVIDQDATYQAIETKIRQAERRLIQEVKVFDVYENEAVLGKNKKSYSISVLLQSSQQNFGW